MDQWTKSYMLYLYKRVLVCYKGVFNGSDSSSSNCILPSQKRDPLLFIIVSISIVITVVVGVVKVNWSARADSPFLFIHIWK